MDTLWLIIGIILMLAGLLGCILPLIPGPPLCFIALLIVQLRTESPFTTKFLLIWATVAVVVTVLDYVIPLYGTKKFGGSSYGMWGCTIGLIAGLWFGPIGIIVGPFVGAFIGEWIANNDSDKAFQAALGSLIGFLAGTLLKLIVCLVMIYYFIVGIW